MSLSVMKNPLGKPFVYPDLGLKNLFNAAIISMMDVGNAYIDSEQLKKEAEITRVIDCFAWMENRL